MAKVTKRQEYLATLEEKKYTVSEAVKFLKSGPKSNFEESVDVAINLGIDASKSDQTVRSATSLPAGTGKTTKVAVFAETEQAQEAIEAGADVVGMEDLSETMPNPKTGTVTKDIGKAVKNAKAGQIRYRADKSGIIHGRIGDLSYSAEQIQQNIETLLDDLKRNKPASSKGVFIKKLSITSTMGAGIELDMASLRF